LNKQITTLKDAEITYNTDKSQANLKRVMNGKDIKFIELLFYELPEAFSFVQNDLIDASLNMLNK